MCFQVKGIHNLQYHHAIFSNFLFNKNLLDALEDIMDTENIVLHHTKAHYKPPDKGAAYPMHQVMLECFKQARLDFTTHIELAFSQQNLDIKTILNDIQLDI